MSALNVLEEREASDIRLNPELMASCATDIKGHCDKMMSMNEETVLDGVVISCLEKEYIKGDKSVSRLNACAILILRSSSG